MTPLPDFLLGALISAGLIIFALIFSSPEQPYSSLWFGAGVLCFLIVLINGSVGSKIKRDIKSSPYSGSSWSNIRERPSTDVVALIQAMANEGTANRDEEQREDRGKKSREIVTICLLMATLYGIYRQVGEMTKVYIPIKTQADAAKSQAIVAENSVRAWVAPIQFSLVNIQDMSQPLKTGIFYQNVGREPAKSVRDYLRYGYIIGPSLPPENWSDLGEWKTAVSPKEICKLALQVERSSVIYPSTTSGFTIDTQITDSKTFTSSKLAELFDAVKKKQAVYFVSGCFSYSSLGKNRFSAI